MQVNDKKHNALGVIIALAIIAGCVAAIIYASKHREETPAPEAPKYSAVQLLRNQRRNELTPWQKTIMAICWTESKCNPNAVGKAGDNGVMQLIPVYVQEVNRISGSEYSHSDAFSVRKSLEMFERMQAKYNPARDRDLAIHYHNKSAAYKAEVLRNLAWIERYEAVRNEVINYKTNYKTNY